METASQHSLACAELVPIVTDIAAFAGTLEGIDVTDEETQGQLGDLVKMMNHRRRKLEDKRLSLVKPLTGVVSEINAMFKTPRDRIDEIVGLAKKKMNTFARAQQLIADEKRRQERLLAEAERREAQELAAALNKKAGVEAAPVAEQITEAAEKKVEAVAAPAKVAASRGQEASVITSKKWAAEVRDLKALALAVGEGKLPTHVLEPNMAALRDIARESKLTREVFGVYFFQDITTSVR